ncbi:MAG: flagellar motor protein MotB [Ignavibacteriales bacterium]
MARRRRGSGPSGSGSPSWLCTYGDMMSLLLTFFILLFSLSTLSQEKFQMARASLAAVFGAVLEGGPTVIGEGTSPQDLETLLQEIEKQDFQQFEEVRTALSQFIEREGLKGQIEVTDDSRGLVVRFADSVLFDLGRADLRPDAREILDKVAGLISSIPNHVRVEGHTDDLKINTEKFPSNWELSTGRSAAVVRYFIEKHGLPPARLSVAGYGEYRPIAPNDGEENRRKNRRVDIVILRLSTSRSEPVSGGTW